MQKKTLCIAFALMQAAAGAVSAADLADAAMNRDLAKVKALLAQGVDVNEIQHDESTALHWAVNWSDDETVDALIEAGADVEAITRLGATPLYLAAQNGDAALIKRLIDADIDVKASVLNDGENALMFAARSGNLESVKLLIDAGAELDVREEFRGTTALMWAAEQGHTDIVELLLQKGIDPNTRSYTSIPANSETGSASPTGGMTGLILASREGFIDTVKVLLEHGASINQQSGEGNTALIAAIQNGHADLAKLLIERGADPSLANDKGWNPLYLAVKGRTIEVGTMPNPEITDQALYEIIELLLQKGANPNARLSANTDIRNAIRATWLEEDGATPFLRAAMGGDLPVMMLLLQHGADPKIDTRDGTTALMAVAGVGFTNGFMEDFAGHEGSLQAMKLLIELGLDVNAKNNDGTMALHGACHKNFIGGIQMLVDNGADLESRSFRRGTFEQSKEFAGYTPLDWAQGVQTGGESALYNAEATELMEKVLTERGIPIQRNSTTRGGKVAQQ